MKYSLPALTLVCALSLGACGTMGMGGAAGSVAALTAADGSARGTVAVRSGADGTLLLAISAAGLPTGPHGLHLHEKGLCEGPGFTSAGAHWNPTSRKHGRDNPAGAHLGDLPNLAVNTAGRGAVTVPLRVSEQSLRDADGTSLLIHAKGDDYRTDPSGNSGDRIACAIIAPPR